MKSAQSSAAVICFSPLHRDGRVQRQIHALKSICSVTAFGFTDPHIDGVRFVSIPNRPGTIFELAWKLGEKLLRGLLLKTGCFEDAYRIHRPVRATLRELSNHNFSLIVANDINALPVALMSRGSARVLYDAHEYSPRERESSFIWTYMFSRYVDYLCRYWLPQADAMTTVSAKFSQEYFSEFGVQPAIVLNAPWYHSSPYISHGGNTIRMIHHGGAYRVRCLENMIDAVTRLDDRFRLDFMLIDNDSGYLSELRQRASSDARIAFIPPTSPDEIVTTLSAYDIGLHSLIPHSFNARHALPNKFFDFIQARLCLAIGPSPEMKRIVEQYGCGVVADDFTAEALASTLRALDREKVEACRRAADVAAADLCYERSEQTLLSIARCLLAQNEDECRGSSDSQSRGKQADAN